MSFLICPVCKGALNKNEHTYSCNAGHSFDIAREGYVNLLMSQASSQKRHGDDKLMVRSRRDFLDKGYYSALRDAVAEAVASNTAPGAHIIDVGYGEPYKNKPELRDDALFELADFKEMKYTVDLPCSEDIFALFTMTPYYYKTSSADSEKLLSKTSLSTTVHFGVEVYKKR